MSENLNTTAETETIGEQAVSLGDTFEKTVKTVPEKGSWQPSAESDTLLELSPAGRGRVWICNGKHYSFKITNELDLLPRNLEEAQHLIETSAVDLDDIEDEGEASGIGKAEKLGAYYKSGKKDHTEFGKKFEAEVIEEFKKAAKKFHSHGAYGYPVEIESIPKLDLSDSLKKIDVPTNVTETLFKCLSVHDGRLQWNSDECLGDSGVAGIKFQQTMQKELKDFNVKLTDEVITITTGSAQYQKTKDGLYMTPAAIKDGPLELSFNKSVWNALLLGVSTDHGKKSDFKVLDASEKLNNCKAVVRATKSTTKSKHLEAAKGQVQQFFDVIGKMDAKSWEELIKDGLPKTLRDALDNKDNGIGNKGGSGDNGKVARELQNVNIEKALGSYCKSLETAWKSLAECPCAIVLHSAGFKEVYGKTEEDKEATPAKLMAGNGGKVAPPVVLINIDTGEVLRTVAHELAHVVGFNPSGCEASGHFTSSSEYLKTEEGTDLPKIFFDAYFLETLVMKFVSK